MDLSTVLLLYIIILIVLTFIFFKSGIRLFSSIMLSLIICLALLLALRPPNTIDSEKEDSSFYAFYIFIILGTILLVFIYTFIVSLSDKNNRVCRIVDNKCNMFDFVPLPMNLKDMS